MRTTLLTAVLSLLSLPALTANKQSFERALSLSAERISTLHLNTGPGSLLVTGVAGDEIAVHATVISADYADMDEFVAAYERWILFGMERNSEKAMLIAKSRKSMYNTPNIQINLELKVPKRLNVMIDDDSGSIVVQHLHGELTIDDQSGSVLVDNINNNVSIDNASGSLVISDVTGDLVIEDGSGTIEIKNIGGDVEIEDRSGNINAAFIGGDFKLNDGSGEVVIEALQGEFILLDDGSDAITVNGNKIN